MQYKWHSCETTTHTHLEMPFNPGLELSVKRSKARIGHLLLSTPVLISHVVSSQINEYTQFKQGVPVGNLQPYICPKQFDHTIVTTINGPKAPLTEGIVYLRLFDLPAYRSKRRTRRGRDQPTAKYSCWNVG